jgi:hypothetical protein
MLRLGMYFLAKARYSMTSASFIVVESVWCFSQCAVITPFERSRPAGTRVAPTAAETLARM